MHDGMACSCRSERSPPAGFGVLGAAVEHQMSQLL